MTAPDLVGLLICTAALSSAATFLLARSAAARTSAVADTGDAPAAVVVQPPAEDDARRRAVERMATEAIAFQIYLEGHRTDPDDEQLREDYCSALAAMETAWLRLNFPEAPSA